MRPRGLTFLLLAVVLLLGVPSAVGYYTDWLWFGEVGYQSVFLRTLNAQAAVFAATFAVVFVFLYVNLGIARRTLGRPHVVLGTGPDGRPISLEGRQISNLAVALALGFAGLLAVNAAGNWLRWLTFFNGESFGQADPLFGRDVSFYVFHLPVYQSVRAQAMTMTLLTLIGCGLYYVLSGSFVIDPRHSIGAWPRVRLVPAARRHLSILAAVILLLMAWGAWLDVPRSLVTSSTVVFGVSYVDQHARIPFLWITLAVLVLGAGLAIVHGFSRRTWPIVTALVLYFGVTLTGAVYSSVVQKFSVAPNELDKEQPYIAHHIDATRRAYAIDRVEEREVSGDAELRAQDIANNVGTIENVRLWDHEPLKQTFAQIQEIRTYYEFRNVDNDRYIIDGKPRQVMLSARELNTDKMQTRSWLTEHLNYTHGYGLTLGPVNQVTTEGLPVLFVRDLPPVSTKPELTITQPGLYFGEMPSPYALVRTSREEFDYPRAGEDNATTRYEGTGGVPIGTMLRRLLFAIRFGTTDILFTAQTTAESRIIYHRSIRERINLLAPFFQFDLDPYPVISGGRIFWIQDAYTTTANYPYSMPALTPFGTINYIRNSVKIVIDAYNGTMTFYLRDADDPMARTLARVFPGLLRPFAEMPADLQQHTRYPEDLFRIQSAVYTTFHMTNPQDFYAKEDQWQAPILDTGQNPTVMQPYYTIMRLPGEKQTEFIQMLPFTPRAKNNLSAWLAARSDGDRYGRLLVFKFPKQKFISGPQQVAGRISQDQIISQQITLWNQQGSEVVWGTLLVIPVEESLLYIRPLYLRSTAKLPELKKVVVAYQYQTQSQIVMADTLRQALIQIFGQTVAAALPIDRLESTEAAKVPVTGEPPKTPDAPVRPAAGTPTLESLLLQAEAHMVRAEKALKDGDLGTYADENRKAKALIEAAVKIKR